jgi:transposase
VVRSLLRAFAHFGGVPLMSVFDNIAVFNPVKYNNSDR